MNNHWDFVWTGGEGEGEGERNLCSAKKELCKGGSLSNAELEARIITKNPTLS